MYKIRKSLHTTLKLVNKDNHKWFSAIDGFPSCFGLYSEGNFKYCKEHILKIDELSFVCRFCKKYTMEKTSEETK